MNGPLLVKKNEALTFYVSLKASADDDTVQANPTVVAGDVRISTDGSAWANLATTPTVDPAGGQGVKVDLSAAETNGDNFLVYFEDQTAAEEWKAEMFSFHTYAVDQDDLVRSTVPANTLDVSATGEAGVDWNNVGTPGATVALSATTVGTVSALTGHTVQTGDSFARLGAPAGASISVDLAAVKSDSTAILVDTDEMQGDLVNGGRLDLLIDAILADTDSLDTTKIPDVLSLANINAEVDTALNTAIPGAPTADSINQRLKALDELLEGGGSGDAAAILADTNELQGDWVNTGRLDTILDAILDDTGTSGVKLDFSQAYTEGQTGRTIGGSLEVSEAYQRNRIRVTGGNRELYRSNGTTLLITRTQSATEIGDSAT
jgi:hypothetical protein